jgi:hypothetical protein
MSIMQKFIAAILFCLVYTTSPLAERPARRANPRYQPLAPYVEVSCYNGIGNSAFTLPFEIQVPADTSTGVRTAYTLNQSVKGDFGTDYTFGIVLEDEKNAGGCHLPHHEQLLMLCDITVAAYPSQTSSIKENVESFHFMGSDSTNKCRVYVPENFEVLLSGSRGLTGETRRNDLCHFKFFTR